MICFTDTVLTTEHNNRIVCISLVSGIRIFMSNIFTYGQHHHFSSASSAKLISTNLQRIPALIATTSFRSQLDHIVACDIQQATKEIQ
jgi:hypothetical protein